MLLKIRKGTGGIVVSAGYEIVKGFFIAMGILAGCSVFGCVGGYEIGELSTVQYLVQLAAASGTLVISYVLYHVMLYAEQKPAA